MELKDTDFMKMSGDRRPSRPPGDQATPEAAMAEQHNTLKREGVLFVTLPELQLTLDAYFQEQTKTIAALLDRKLAGCTCNSPSANGCKPNGQTVSTLPRNGSAEKLSESPAVMMGPGKMASTNTQASSPTHIGFTIAPTPSLHQEWRSSLGSPMTVTESQRSQRSKKEGPLTTDVVFQGTASPESSSQAESSSWHLRRRTQMKGNRSKMSASWQVVLEDRAEQSRAGDEDYPSTRWQDTLIRYFEMAMSADEPKREGFLATIVLSRTFDICCGLVILVNAGFTSWSTDQDARYLNHPPRDVEAVTLASELFFLIFYTLELLAKLLVHRSFFFWNDNFAWNMLDLALVFMAAYDFILTIMIREDDSVNFVFVRTIRIFKLAKILRVIRVMRFFSELRLMVNSLAGSLFSLFWSFVMLAFIVYIFGLMFVQGVATYLSEEPPISDEERNTLIELFGRVSRAMLSLYQSATGGEDWHIFYTSIEKTGVFNSILYIFFIGFIQIALLNILTGIFVENAMKLAQPDRETLALEQRKREIIEADEMMQLCEEMDMDQSGTINAQEVGAVLRSRRMRAHLAVLGLEIRDAEMFFKMLAAVTENDEVDIHSFVSGCMRMKGNATSLDLQGLGFQTALVHRTQKQCYEDLAGRLDLLYTTLGGTPPPMVKSVSQLNGTKLTASSRDDLNGAAGEASAASLAAGEEVL
mmetsp:Transcript_41825/g.94076  ORF Transcript_41825/g.94076 Transcript_41825/m.94076 type:complete len:699 (+) Transcript_41825:155-2251(+)